MASLSIVAASFRNKAITSASPRVLVPLTTKQFHVSTRKEASVCEGADGAKNAAASAHEKVAKKVEEGTQAMSEVTGNIKDKAKQTAEDAWDKVKDTTDKIKEKVVGKSEETKESVRDAAKTVERSMNTKELKN